MSTAYPIICPDLLEAVDRELGLVPGAASPALALDSIFKDLESHGITEHRINAGLKVLRYFQTNSMVPTRLAESVALYLAIHGEDSLDDYRDHAVCA
ncbi:hypothetical protein NQ011_01340 [Corynebacterium phoceense]|uniref:hypothetical protein n=1 Tax=Corynebacterium phoceense TaxID=1686286 RepID=UPI00211B9998|nr:hypothetical protein [Corynebacterium phoceense]MCQ9335358.1 hypothetical protein [Corynebacterium phoceense]